METNSKQNKVGWEMVHGFTSEKPAVLVFFHHKPTEYALESQV
jgi:AICAR transformylase/IMP cyclohydrolase PurH